MNENSISTRNRLWVFQLYLLSLMRVHPAILDVALGRLGATEEDLRDAKGKMSTYGFGAVTTSTKFYREILGEPSAIQSLNNSLIPAVFNGSHALYFKLPLWNDFEFVVNESPDGLAWDPGFKRPISESNTLVLDSVLDLKPWNFLKEEITNRFGAPKNGDGWDHWEELYYQIPPTPGAPLREYFIVFDFNLLQSVEPA